MLAELYRALGMRLRAAGEVKRPSGGSAKCCRAAIVINFEK
jgi:hypothetical protein